MPCNDVTETLLLKLDHTYNIQKYTLQKRTCGAEVAERSLLQTWLQSKTTEELLAMNTQDFLDFVKPQDINEQFAYLKHFDTLRFALQVLLGQEGSSTKSTCVIDDIIHNDKGVYAVMFIKVDIDTTKITACSSGCGSGGCGS